MIQFPPTAAHSDSDDRGEFQSLPQPPSPTAARWGDFHNNESVTSLDTIQNSRPGTLRSSSNINLINNYSSATLLPGTSTPGPSTPGPAYGSSLNAFNHGRSFSDTSSYDGATACPTPALQDESISYEEFKKEDPATARKVRHFNTFNKRFDTSVYQIETLHKHDDEIFLPPWKRNMYRLSPLFTLLACGSYFLYYAYRIICIVDVQKAYDKVYIMAWLFIAAEGCVACPALLHQLYQMLSIRGRSRPKLRLRGEEVPTVDVFVTCCGEDVDVVLDTARAAAAGDYPQDRFRVVVLDDGKDPELEKAVNDLSLEYPNVYYHARIKIKGVPHHFKAGNLTGGTNFVVDLEGGEAEFIAALDADMIPEADWLRAIIAHMVIDDKMALVCPPQLFYNVPQNDPLCQSLDAFVHVMEPTKDANGVAWCTGSGYAIRRAALDDIGGWPVGSLAEDTFTSSLLLGAGWRTAFCHEALQFGTVPDTITGHLKQRTRWTLGTLQTALKLRFCLFGDLVKGMSFFARLSAFVFAIDAFFKIFLCIALLTIPIVLISGGQLVAYNTETQLKWQIRLCFIQLVLTRLNEWVTYIPSGYRLAQRDSGAQLWMAPFHAKTIIMSFLLPSWLGGKPMAFSSSGSQKSDINERDPRTRAGVFRRLWVILWDCQCYMHLLYILFVIAAVTYSTVRGLALEPEENTLKKKLIYLLTHAFWPPMLWMMCLTACFEPIRYAIWPPTMPDREELLDRDDKTQIARPKEEWKKARYAKTTFFHEFQYTLLTAFTCMVFVGAFFIDI
ncbi:hypothetical protein BPAE_0027g00020 [Botrytis paeoniae]|uniref:Glycosyltransferase 2-like domain-containing protein n=1 Tax=Botrytis paeoniae TaxID=278948 RepID=A0A4Z1FV85_9HELO|nr:hypothetical protein BPAE_0027g00020 [Botrytis paeoniae]